MSEHEIQSDGTTVWVHTAAGTIARFGPRGVDVHTADTSACLACTHGPTGAADWELFREQDIEVGDEHRPAHAIS